MLYIVISAGTSVGQIEFVRRVCTCIWGRGLRAYRQSWWTDTRRDKGNPAPKPALSSVGSCERLVVRIFAINT